MLANLTQILNFKHNFLKDVFCSQTKYNCLSGSAWR